MISFASSLDDKGKITLNRETFKVLASETRVGILKNLDDKQMTVSDLARAMEMNKATLFEHLEKMITAGLIKKKEDERKWVYYHITWKGKNILHPERTKIMIALGISIICSIILISLLIAAINQGFPIFGSEEKDYEPPTIEYIDPSDINILTEGPMEFKIEISDNIKINRTSLKFEYILSNLYVDDIELLDGWSDLPFSIDKSIATLELPSIDWANNSGKYLYLRSYAWDINGNYAEKIHSDYVDNIYENSLDLSISRADVTFGDEIDSIGTSGSQKIPVKIIVHNTGSTDVSNASLRIYRNNPDLDSNGFVDDQSTAIISDDLGIIGAEGIINMEYVFYLDLNLTQNRTFYVAVDPYNRIDEINETNNIVGIKIISDHKEVPIPEFTTLSFLLSAVFIVLFSYITRFRGKEGKK
jgi:DNA-binding transcriptional ArsR family regulator